MCNTPIYVYVDPKENIESYPDNLMGDMSVFKGFRFEVQWLFYLMLRGQGLRVEICREYPESGIMIIHMGNVRRFVWHPNLYVVSGQWDYPRDDRAQLHLVSNDYVSTDASLSLMDRLTFPGFQCNVAPVTHPVIIPRDPLRGDRFDTVAFIGDPKNLDEQFRTETFREKVDALGMKFVIQSDPAKMSDFSDVDAVIAVRKIGKVISNKPATKLFNAWRGGVPSLLGCEIGYREVRETDFDYVEVDSVEDVIQALTRLKTDFEFRQKMIGNGLQRAKRFSAEEQAKTWARFFRDQVLPANDAWQQKSIFSKTLFLGIRWLRYIIRHSLSFIWHDVLNQKYSDYKT